MGKIEALPFAFSFSPKTTALIVIDMQRDFAEPGGFGASLGNDVSRIGAIVPTVKRLIEGFRSVGLPVIHTMECHRPDLSDLPAAKRDRGNPSIRIGDRGPMGRVLIAGEPGTAAIAALVPTASTIWRARMRMSRSEAWTASDVQLTQFSWNTCTMAQNVASALCCWSLLPPPACCGAVPRSAGKSV